MSNPITVTAIAKDSHTLVEIQIEGGVCAPEDLKTMFIPFVQGDRGVVLSGRAPVWVFATLVHEFHATQWVATFDPRLNGSIVVESHTQGIAVGDVIPV